MRKKPAGAKASRALGPRALLRPVAFEQIIPASIESPFSAHVAIVLCFHHHGNMTRQAPKSAGRVAEYADMFSAMGTPVCASGGSCSRRIPKDWWQGTLQ